MISIFLTIFLIFIFLIPATFMYAAVRAVAWVPAKRRDVSRIMKHMTIKPGDMVYDLGCGDGRLLVAAAKAGARATGFEISLMQFLMAWIRVQFGVTPKPKVKFRDFWHTSFTDADVIYCFLIPRVMSRLRDKCLKELKPGARVVSYMWSIPGWEPVAVDAPPGERKIFVYER